MSTLVRKSPRGTWRFRILLAGLLAGSGWAAAGESRIELRDGSVLRGELLSVEEGSYRVRTANLGEIEVRESDLIAIRPLGESGELAASDASAPLANGVAGSDYSAQIGAIQRQLVADPGLMQAVQALQSDPELQSALADPEFAGKVMAGNLAALAGDPRFLRLLAHPSIRAVLGRVASPPSGP